MKIKSWHMCLIVLILIFGGIAGTMAFNLWNTKGGGGSQGGGGGQGTGRNKVPVTFNLGEFTGEYNPADISGSYSFGYIGELWEIPLTELGTAFGLGAIENLADFKCKVTLTEDQAAFLDTHSVDISGLQILKPSTVTGEGTPIKGHE